MATYGFENHTPDQALIVGEPMGNTLIQTTIIAKDTITDWNEPRLLIVMQGLVVGTDRIGGYFTRREAIFLRNRLTAFIEKGIGGITE